MKIIVAPNSFRESLTSELASKFMIEGVRRAAPYAAIVDLPLADGGDGTLSCMLRILGGRICSMQARDPRGKLIKTRFALTLDRRTAIIEMAEVNGARLVPPTERNPLYYSSYGTGELLRAVMDLNVQRIYLGIGGSSTMDGGAGALTALGVKFLDVNGKVLLPTPYDLVRLHEVDTSNLDSRLQHLQLTILCDVHTSYRECVSLYGPQKGAKAEDLEKFERVLFKLASLAHNRGYSILEKPWLGAGGGLAGGLVAFANAEVVGGAKYLCSLAGVEYHLRDTDILLTGEGRFDKGSFRGKLPLSIAMIAAHNNVPAIIMAGQVVEEDVESLPDLITLVSLAKSSAGFQEMLQDLPLRLSNASEEVIHRALKEIVAQ
jgi:glycerate 2-kinase